jgi:hypothetical protein
VGSAALNWKEGIIERAAILYNQRVSLMKVSETITMLFDVKPIPIKFVSFIALIAGLWRRHDAKQERWYSVNSYFVWQFCFAD